jgi:hypothetical protein
MVDRKALELVLVVAPSSWRKDPRFQEAAARDRLVPCGGDKFFLPRKMIHPRSCFARPPNRQNPIARVIFSPVHKDIDETSVFLF